jgi:hypothetical protein
MEKQPHQEYRDELADKLKEIRNSDAENPEIAKAKAQGYLDAKQETEEYKTAKESHVNTVEINGQKIELGPVIGRLGEKFVSRLVENHIDNINRRLKPGESPWRLLTRKELEEINRTIREILDTENMSEEERIEKAKKYLNELGLVFGDSYWFDKGDISNFDGNRECWNSENGFFQPLYSTYKAYIKCVR